jgi:hypothetical protein
MILALGRSIGEFARDEIDLPRLMMLMAGNESAISASPDAAGAGQKT